MTTPAIIEALKRARDYLYNSFEPDNQSAAYHDINDAIKLAESGQVQPDQPTFNIAAQETKPVLHAKSTPVWVVVRHTRAGDQRLDIIDQGKFRPGAAREIAMERAQEIAQRAAYDYGHGSASVFAGTLWLSDKAEKPS